MNEIRIKGADGSEEVYRLPEQKSLPEASGPYTRIAYAAAHVVPLKHDRQVIDWEATINFRKHLWSYGLGVAEAMDTAQRGMGLSWEMAKDLIRRSIVAKREFPNAFLACGCNTDQLDPEKNYSLEEVQAAYEEQIDWIEGHGGKLIIMASRALVIAAQSPDDYLIVYGNLLKKAKDPVIIHWLGEMFDPQLKGYWGSEDHYEAMETVLKLMKEHSNKVDGIKLSLLDKDKEVFLRAKLPEGVRMYTGDDFNFSELIEGDGEEYSDALLGIFDGIAPVAAAALKALSEGDVKSYRELLAPTVPLSRHIFGTPTRFYKTGVVFLAWLNGFQDDFIMLSGQETARDRAHLIQLFKLAAEASVFRDSKLAINRMQAFLQTEKR